VESLSSRSILEHLAAYILPASFSTQEVDDELDQGDEAADGEGESSRALKAFLMLSDPLLDGADTSGVAIADLSDHLVLEHGQIGENLCFEIGHYSCSCEGWCWALLRVRGAGGNRRRRE
jgi:hypothetical protein